MMKRHTPIDTPSKAGSHRRRLLLTADQLLRELVQVIEFFLAKHLAYVLR